MQKHIMSHTATHIDRQQRYTERHKTHYQSALVLEWKSQTSKKLRQVFVELFILQMSN